MQEEIQEHVLNGCASYIQNGFLLAFHGELQENHRQIFEVLTE